MSRDMSDWAWDQDLPSSQKLVLLCLADHHNSLTGRCFPSCSTICDMTGLNKKTVPVALQSLADRNLITIDRKPGRSPEYRFNRPPNYSPKRRYTQKRDNPNSGIPNFGVCTKNGETTVPDIGDTPSPKLGYESGSNREGNQEQEGAVVIPRSEQMKRQGNL